MSRFARLASATIVALCLSGQSALRAGETADPIRVLCDDARLVVLCGALAEALAEQQTAHPVEVTESATGGAHLTIRFVPERVGDSVLAGHLSWTDGAGRTGAGSRIDLTVMDAAIDEEMLRSYARQLLGFTDLPL